MTPMVTSVTVQIINSVLSVMSDGIVRGNYRHCGNTVNKLATWCATIVVAKAAVLWHDCDMKGVKPLVIDCMEGSHPFKYDSIIDPEDFVWGCLSHAKAQQHQ